MPPKGWTKRRARLNLLFPSANSWGWVGTQPQGDMGGLHRLPHDSYEVAAQGVQVSLVTQLGREGFQGLCCIILSAVEAPVYERLDAASSGVEQSRYHQSGDDHSQLWLPLLTGEGTEDRPGCRYAPEVHKYQRRG